MGAMRGGSSVNHRLTLQLGSSRTAPAPAADQTIAEIASSDPQFSTLVARSSRWRKP